jgi:ribosome biogenesis GTPase
LAPRSRRRIIATVGTASRTCFNLSTYLERFGWDAAWDALFASHRAAGLEPARICLEHNHVYRVALAGGEALAEAAGRIKHHATGRPDLPAVGDWVAVWPDASGGRGSIRAVLPRRPWFSRKAAGRDTAEQVIAANIDLVLVVFGLDVAVNARAIERYLLVARQSRARPVVILNKADLVADPPAAVAEAIEVAGDVAVHAVSSHSGHGLAAIEAHLAPGVTLALIGPSGAGKSSIVNRLVGTDLLRTGEVREWDARGRHTSVHRQLVLREAGGLIIDTPGMRELQLWDTDAAVTDAFEDIAALADRCRFRDCRHDQEPDCAVRAAVDAGVLDAGRYGSYLKLQSEQAATAKRRDERSLIEEKRKGKVIHKALRSMQKQRGR